MLISQRVSSIYKSIPRGCLAGAPSPSMCVHRVFFIRLTLRLVPTHLPSRHCSHRRNARRKETFVSRNFIPSGLDRKTEKTKIMRNLQSILGQVICRGSNTVDKRVAIVKRFQRYIFRISGIQSCTTVSRMHYSSRSKIMGHRNIKVHGGPGKAMTA